MNSNFDVPYIKIDHNFFWIHPSPALSGSENFILAKNWSQDPIFVVTSFLSILSMSSKFSIGHGFYLFKLIFSMVTSFVLLSEKNIKKIKRKGQRIPKKQRQPKNREKRGTKVEQYLKEHIEKAKVRSLRYSVRFASYPLVLSVSPFVP